MRENHEKLIKMALYKFKHDRDYEDLQQELYIHLMSFPDEWSDGRVVVILQFRAIDWLRNRDRRYRNGELRPIIGLEGWAEPTEDEPIPRPSVFLGLSGREGTVADMWYDGHLGEYIAKEIGVTQSRVSQIVSDIRKKVKRMDGNDKKPQNTNRTTSRDGES